MKNRNCSQRSRIEEVKEICSRYKRLKEGVVGVSYCCSYMLIPFALLERINGKYWNGALISNMTDNWYQSGLE